MEATDPMTSERASTTTRTALVTGASAGIGRAIAIELANRGFALVLVARREQALEILAADLRERYGVAVRVAACDLAREGAAAALFDELKGEETRIDVLVNNAGVGLYGAFSSSDTERVDRMLALNVATPTHLTRFVLDGMLERGEGRILMVASTAALKPGPWNAVYAASKTYLASFSRALASELDGSGVTVTVLCPGATDTDFARAADLAPSQRIAAKGVAAPEEVARVGVDAMLVGRGMVIVGLTNRILAVVLRLLPERVVTRLMNRVRRGEEP
jgi:hypothetical protein